MRLRRTLSLSQQQPAATDTHTDTHKYTQMKKKKHLKTRLCLTFSIYTVKYLMKLNKAV